jgi:hypothetical protein
LFAFAAFMFGLMFFAWAKHRSQKIQAS